MRKLLAKLVTQRYTPLGMGGAFLLGNIIGLLPKTSWWVGDLYAVGAGLTVAVTVNGVRWLSCHWLRKHPARRPGEA